MDSKKKKGMMKRRGDTDLPYWDPTLTFSRLRGQQVVATRVHDEGPSRKDCLPEDQRNNMTMTDIYPLSQLVVAMYTAPSFIALTSIERT